MNKVSVVVPSHDVSLLSFYIKILHGSSSASSDSDTNDLIR